MQQNLDARGVLGCTKSCLRQQRRSETLDVLKTAARKVRGTLALPIPGMRDKDTSGTFGVKSGSDESSENLGDEVVGMTLAEDELATLKLPIVHQQQLACANRSDTNRQAEALLVGRNKDQVVTIGSG